ncbi:hypothetical protein KA047_01190 [Candidatus Saccharibacteria bacterium]|jgi:hypothetical protein|nr:hypothetical protein [Candidatus Saccharibacteria bacterium]
MAERPETFTREDLQQVFSGLDEQTAQVALGALDQFVVERQQTRKNEEITGVTFRFLEAYQRTSADGASDSNIEGWTENLERYSRMYLVRTADIDGQADELVGAMKDLSAVLAVMFGYESCLDEDEMPFRAIDRAGVNQAALAARIKASLQENAPTEDIRRGYDNLSFSDLTVLELFAYSAWESIVDPLADKAVRLAAEQGIVVPPLTAEGLTPEEAEEVQDLDG